jgi:XTP/dITP diphosphohydrolase
VKKADARSPREIVAATTNQGKVREIRKALEEPGLEIRALTDLGPVPTVDEDGETFSENALIKARFYSKHLGKTVVCDDSGLEVDALGGLPGVRSARYAGERATDEENNRKLLEALDKVPLSRRRARFRCSIALVSPDGREAVVDGICAGRIGLKGVGKGGFGYDPLLFLPSEGKTVAQLTIEEKNRVSHRGRALRKLRKVLRTFFD